MHVGAMNKPWRWERSSDVRARCHKPCSERSWLDLRAFIFAVSRAPIPAPCAGSRVMLQPQSRRNTGGGERGERCSSCRPRPGWMAFTDHGSGRSSSGRIWTGSRRPRILAVCRRSNNGERTVPAGRVACLMAEYAHDTTSPANWSSPRKKNVNRSPSGSTQLCADVITSSIWVDLFVERGMRHHVASVPPKLAMHRCGDFGRSRVVSQLGLNDSSSITPSKSTASNPVNRRPTNWP